MANDTQPTAPAAQPSNNGAAIQKQPQAAATELFAGTADFGTAQRIAQALASSSLVPKEYQGSVPNVLIAMEVSNRIGASVFSVMQSLDIIHGRPSWRAQFLIATVNASGRFTPLRFRWQGEEGTKAWGCRAVAKDIESGEECLGALITMQIAHDEGWSTKNGTKWKTFPEQMLMYRAAAFWTRVYAPELSLGMQTSEETVDTLAAQGQSVELPAHLTPGGAAGLNATLGLSREPEPAPAPVVEATIEPPDAPAAAPHDQETGELFEAEKPKGKR